jgi:hypothetical protein
MSDLLPEDQEYKNLIDSLRQLKKVTAPPGFESDLMRKINQETIKVKKGFWQRILTPSILIPSSATLVTAAIIIFIVTKNSDDINSSEQNLNQKKIITFLPAPNTEIKPLEDKSKPIKKTTKVGKKHEVNKESTLNSSSTNTYELKSAAPKTTLKDFNSQIKNESARSSNNDSELLKGITAPELDKRKQASDTLKNKLKQDSLQSKLK